MHHIPILLTLIFGVGLGQSQSVFHDGFDPDSGSWSDRWSPLSSSGSFEQKGRGEKAALGISVESGDTRVGLKQALNVALEPGELTLRARVRWVKGEGKLLLRVQRELEPAMNKTQHDLAKLEYRVSPEWDWRHCWTQYRNGTQPTPQPVDEPRKPSECSVVGSFDSPLEKLYLLVQLERGDPNSREPFELFLEDIEIVYERQDAVTGSLSQSCWTTGPLVLTIANNGPATGASCEVVDSQGVSIWSETVQMNANAARVVSVPQPPAADTIQEYRLRVARADAAPAEKPALDWPVWMPPQEVISQINGWKSDETKASAESTRGEPRFTYWSDDIPNGRSAMIPPADWVEAPRQGSVSQEPAAEPDQEVFIYKPILQQDSDARRVPSSDEAERVAVLAFPGERSLAHLGVYALDEVSSLDVQINHDLLPGWLKNRVTLRQLLYLAEGDATAYSYIAGPYVKPEPAVLGKGHNARYAVVVELPEDAKPGLVTVPLTVSVNGEVVGQSVEFRVLPLKLEAADRFYGLFSGPYGDPQQRLGFYHDMAAMGLNFPAIYNLSPCEITYENGELSIDFQRFETELHLLRKTGVLADNSPMMIDMRFLESQISELTTQILEKKPGVEPAINRKATHSYKPNHSELEAEYYVQVVRAIEQRRKEKPDLWPSRMLYLPEDEIEWGRMDKTERFAILLKQLGCEVLAVSDGIRWGWDGPERLDEVVDYRVYGYMSEQLLDVIQRSGDTYGLYTYPHDFVIGWAYHASLYQPHSVLKWTYWWPISGGYYKLGRPASSAGRSYAWPGDNGALPSDYTFEIAEATRDAGLLKLCEAHIQQRGGESLVAECLERIQKSIPLEVKDLSWEILDGDLPRGNAVAWRQVLSAALIHEQAGQE